LVEKVNKPSPHLVTVSYCKGEEWL